MEKLYLLDVSGYIFRAYYALPAMSSPSGEPTHAVYGFIRSVLKLLKEFAPQYIAAVFDGPDSKKSRTEIFADYKAHRRPTPEDLPLQVQRAREFCELIGIPTVEVPGFEADDAMGSIATGAAKEKTHVFLCTSDKDFCQLVNERIFMLNPFKDYLLIDAEKVEELHGVRPEQIIDLLALMGDTADNIPGLPGIGPKTAASLLQQFGSLDEILAHPDQVAGKKKQETVREGGELARLSRELATIHVHLDCPIHPDQLAKKQTNHSRLQEFLQQLGFTSILREMATPVQASETEELRYQVVDTPKDLDQLIKKLSSADEIAFDTETTSLRPHDAELVGVGFCTAEGEAWYVPTNGTIGCEAVVQAIKPLFEDPNLHFMAHNAKYDLHVLSNYGIEIASLSFDTMLASYLLRSHSHRHSLDHLTLHYYNKIKTPIKELIGSGKKEISMSEVPIDRVGPYCCEDVDYTYRLKQLLAPELEKRGLTPLFQSLELPLMQVLLKMERHGIYVDVAKLHSLSQEFQSQLAHLQAEIHQLAGGPFKINSPKQLSHVLFEKLGIKPTKRTTTGYSTRAEVLERLVGEHPMIEKLLRYRALEKLRSTYVDTLPNMVSPKTHRIHCTFNQVVAATGRLSAQDPNLQNIPVRTPEGREIREAFRPQAIGWQFLSADYSQIELRLLAHLCQDTELVRAFSEGEDIHTFTASQVFNTPLADVTRQQRHQAKAVNFGILYGQQAFGLSQQLKVPVRDAARFIETYFDRYPRVRHFLQTAIQQARESGKATTMMGRERLIPEIHSQNAVQRAAAERLAINTPLQGTAADLIKQAMLDVDHALLSGKLASLMLLQIHDELLFEVPDHEVERLSQLVREKMEGVIELSVPLLVDIHVGNNWGAC